MSAVMHTSPSPGGGDEGVGPASKKRRRGDDSFSFPTSFEEDLAMLEAAEQEEAMASGAPPPHSPNSTPSLFTPSPSSSSQGVRSATARPPPPTFDPSTDTVVFQQLDIDHYVDKPIQEMGGSNNGVVPILRLFGVTMEGNSVCAHVHGFLPYFYVLAPADVRPDHCAIFRASLNNAVMADSRSNRDGARQAVVAVEMVQKSSMYGFQFNRMSTFLKITVATPKLVAPAKRMLSTHSLSPFGSFQFQVFESNVDFEIRFMVDADIVGCNWIVCPPGSYTLRRPAHSSQSNGLHTSTCPSTGFTMIGATASASPRTKCQVELDVGWEGLVSHAAEGEWQKIAPVRILSFDIECAGRKGVFPEPEHDPVIQIANMVVLQGERDPFVRNVFTFGECAPVVGSDVRCFTREGEMLQVRVLDCLCSQS